jgi:hypothetical protein
MLKNSAVTISEWSRQGPEMAHVCALITIAMQLTCVVDKEIVCTDNYYLAQLLNVPSCERVFSHKDSAGFFAIRQQP